MKDYRRMHRSWCSAFFCGIFLLYALILNGCTGHAHQRLPKLALSPASFGGEFSVSQRLNFSALTPRADGPAPIAIDALLEITPTQLQLVGFALNRRVLTLRWDGSQLNIERSNKLPPSLDPAQILRDIQLVYWPIGTLQAALPKNWQIRSDAALQRQLQQGKTVWLTISEQADAQGHSVVLLENRAEGYRLQIQSVANTP
jgi:hypothetical protein